MVDCIVLHDHCTTDPCREIIYRRSDGIQIEMISVYLLSRGKLNAEETKRRDDSVKAASRSDESILVVTNDV